MGQAKLRGTFEERKVESILLNKREKERNMQNQQRLPAIAPGILPGVNPEDLTKVTCKHCGEEGTKFIPICELRHASRFQSSTGQPMLVNFQGGFACSKCGAVNEFTVPGVTDQVTAKEELN